MLIGAIISGGIVYAAVSANEVSYTNNKNVKQALDDLYSKVPVNKGELNFNPSGSESVTVEPGNYSGGTLSSANAYNAGKNSAIYSKHINTSDTTLNNGKYGYIMNFTSKPKMFVITGIQDGQYHFSYSTVDSFNTIYNSWPTSDGSNSWCRIGCEDWIFVWNGNNLTFNLTGNYTADVYAIY